MRKLIIFPVLLFIFISCDGENAFIEDYTLYYETTKSVYDTIYHTRIDSLGNEVTDTFITEQTEEIRNDLKITIDSICFMFPIEGVGSMQGADCYNNLVFQFCEGFDYASCHDMTNGKKQAIFKLPGSPGGINYHCNNADFSNSFYHEGDEFPLIYISQGGPRHVTVGRITRKKSSFIFDVIQTIYFPFLPTSDIVIDKDNGFMYAYEYNIHKQKLYKFKTPDYNTSDKVVLTEQDILEIITINNVTYNQGATVRDGFLYMVEGVPSWGTDVYLKIININNGSYTVINLSKSCNFRIEPEDVFFYNDELYCATNYGKGVHKIFLNFNY